MSLPVSDAVLLETLTSLFGYTTFRLHQEAVVRSVLNGQDSFTIMPTGGGKSLCYQLPAFLMEGVCVVISPLISLMKDQVDAARSNGLRAATLNSTTSVSERNTLYAALRTNELDLLYLSPERLGSHGFMDYLKTLPISFFAIDEAHCISQWGHDFRPDYLALSALAEHFPHLPIAAFTATATPRVAEDIVERLSLRDPYRVCASFNRPNLFYQVLPKDDLNTQLLTFLQHHPGESGIIYRTTRKNVDDTAAFLQKKGLSVKAYHAGLPDAERAHTQEDFRQDICPVIVATIAFGMGIDKPNVRFVIHADLPKNMEGYYQETGRAGRDGDPARCLLLYDQRDIAQLLRFAHQIEDAEQQQIAVKQVYTMMDFTQKDSCRRAFLLSYFGETLPTSNCGGCDICTGDVKREDATVAAQKVLSAVVRSGNRFGSVHIIDILMGANTQRIRATGHDTLPTYGVGKDKDRRYWRRIIDAVVVHGLARIEDPEYPVLQVTDKGWAVLRGQEPFLTLQQAIRPPRKPRQRDTNGGVLVNGELFERLRVERTRLAREASIPPYIIFHDSTLREMASVLPDSREAFLQISGVGRQKLETYGAAFLAVIALYKQEGNRA
ncbi:MAG: DNA helicase RecQ [Bilophila sp.]